MLEILEKIIPNVLDKPQALMDSIQETLVMTAWSGVFIFVFGLFFGVILTVTKPGGICENKGIFQVLDKCINFFRSIPFIILLAGLMPLSRMIMGTAIGVPGAIVPLVFGATPFFTRQIENAFAEVDYGLIEAAQSMGCSAVEIVFQVYFKESIPGIARGTTITIISLMGLTAMAGAVGAGGLGDFAIRYGHDRNQVDVTYVTILVLVIFVSVIQFIGTLIEKKNTH
jgi:D-methionine transport system permease protein